MDMLEAPMTYEVDDRACQVRCASVQGCAHFAFYAPLAECHLQSSTAVLLAGQAGWLSGPPLCGGTSQPSPSATQAPPSTSCWEDGSAYVPFDLLGSLPSTAASIFDCQAACLADTLCAVFTYDLATRTCHFQEASATRVESPLLSSKTGPARCPERAANGVISGFITTHITWARPLPVLYSGFGFGIASAALLAFAAFACRFDRTGAREAEAPVRYETLDGGFRVSV